MKIPSPEECYQKLVENANRRMEDETSRVIYMLENHGLVFTQNSEVAEAFLEAGYQVTCLAKPTAYKIRIKEVGDI